MITMLVGVLAKLEFNDFFKHISICIVQEVFKWINKYFWRKLILATL
jgi:hypothetical protein